MNAFDDYVARYEALLNERAKDLRVSVLILGPNMEKQIPAAGLRKHLMEKCNQGDRVAICGEHKKLIDAFTRQIDKYQDLCTYEITLADASDALVIIPDSAGSFVELGMFSLIDDVCNKTCVLFDRQYEPVEDSASYSFIHLGPKASYDLRSAYTEYVNYEEVSAAWDIIDDFLNRIRAIKLSKRLTRGN